MSSKTARRAFSVSGVAVLALVTVFTPQVAFADTQQEEPPETVSASMPMSVDSYDAAIAEANGFEIVTDESGETRSIPVTDEAKALVAAAEAEAPEVVARDTVVGNCGQAWLNGSKGANNKVSFTTGYSVRLPVQLHQWRVSAIGTITGGEQNYAQGAGGAVWSKAGSTTAIGPGWALVPPLSQVAMVKLVDGSTCYSGGPSFTFG